MPMLVDGKWDIDADHSTIKKGRYIRRKSQFRNWITADGSSGFKAEAGRYHLYSSHSCPWAYRVRLFRTLKGLEDVIGESIAPYSSDDYGWTYVDQEGCIPDTVNGKTYLHEIYTLADPEYTGRPTVPTLWDSERNTIISNESADIIRMLNSEFGEIAPDTIDYYPVALRTEIDAVNEFVYANINNGVYLTGFAKTQVAYEEGVARLFSALDELEQRLGKNRYLCGTQITEADWRLFATLIRFDQVYYVLFKCCRRHIYEYHNLWNYTLELYQYPGVAQLTRFDLIKAGYFGTMADLNPNEIVPISSQELDYNATHDREKLRKEGDDSKI